MMGVTVAATAVAGSGWDTMMKSGSESQRMTDAVTDDLDHAVECSDEVQDRHVYCLHNLVAHTTVLAQPVAGDSRRTDCVSAGSRLDLRPERYMLDVERGAGCTKQRLDMPSSLSVEQAQVLRKVS